MSFIVKSIRRFPYLFLTFFFALGIVVEYNFQLCDANMIGVAVSFAAALVMFVAYMLMQRLNMKNGTCQDGACPVSTEWSWMSSTSMLSLFVLFFFLGGYSEHLCHPISAGELESIGATEMSVKVAKITSVPKLTKNGKVNVEAEVFFDENENGVKTMITIDSNRVSFKKEDLILFSSSLKSTESNESIGFNYDTYLRKKGVEATAFVKQYRNLNSDDGFSLETVASNLNLALQKSVANDMANTRNCPYDADARNLITAITLGNKTEMADDLKEAYSRAGASHLLAVSGLHVGIIIIIVECLVGKVVHPKRRPYLFALALLSIIWGYAFLAGLAASVVRTSLMYTVYRVAILLFSKPNPINVVLFTAFMMLVNNPFNIFDLGFQLSFSAVYSILIFGQPLIKKLEGCIPEIKIPKKKVEIEEGSVETGHAPSSHAPSSYAPSSHAPSSYAPSSYAPSSHVPSSHVPSSHVPSSHLKSLISFVVSGLNKLRTYVIGSIAISMAAQILTTPITLYTFHTFPILSILSSLITIPLVTILIPLAFVYYGLVGMATVIPVLSLVAGVVLYVSTLVANSVNAIVYFTANISVSTINRLPFYNYDVLAYITISLLLAAYCNYRRLSLLWIATTISIAYFACASIDGIATRDSKLLAVYNVNGTTAINRMSETNTLFVCNDTLKVSKKAGEFWTNRLTSLPSTSDKSSFAFGKDRIYILSDKDEVKIALEDKLDVDILILANNVATKVQDLENFRYKKLIVDGSNKYYVAKKWVEERRKSGVDCHIVRFDGSFYLVD